MKDKNKTTYDSTAVKWTWILLIITTWFFPGQYAPRLYGEIRYGRPLGYLTFYPPFRHTLWRSTGINLLYLSIDFLIIYAIVRAVMRILEKMRQEK